MLFRGKYYWASNFAFSPIKYKIGNDEKETIFPTAEHLYQALKYIDKPEVMRIISNLQSPVDAKRIGKEIPANSEYLKEDYRLSTMKTVMDLKYKIPLFRAYLLSTKDQEIIHDVYHNDTFFGKANGNGLNHLGIILMEIREKLKQEIKDSNFKDNKLLPLDVNKASLRIAGIGSRNLPEEIKIKIEEVMLFLNTITNNKLIVHTGDADGSDLYFKANAKNCISYLPFKGFNNSTSDKFIVCNKAVTLASFHHPYFEIMKNTTKQLMGRNVYQIMSDTFDNIVDCVICYTPDGVEKSKDVTVGKTGGTGLAISLADTIGVPVFNLAKSDSVARIKEFYFNIENNTPSFCSLTTDILKHNKDKINE